MPQSRDWSVSPAMQPNPEDYSYDLDHALTSVVSLRATIPPDAFTAEVLGTERGGNGVIIREDGIVLTIGYLITEASSVWIGLDDGRVVEGHVLGHDQESGFGLVQALARLELPALPLGNSSAAPIQERVVVGGFGGRGHSVAARIIAKQEFAGYWEYLLDEAIFTAPAHPNWGGTAVIGPRGDLLGIGSLQLEQARTSDHLNMVVPIDLLKPIFNDLLTLGWPNRPPRPWLGIYAIDIDARVVVAGVATRGPADRAELRSGDVLLAINGTEIDNGSAGFFRQLWALGPAGVDVPLTVYRDGITFDVTVRSGDRRRFLKTPRLH